MFNIYLFVVMEHKLDFIFNTSSKEKCSFDIINYINYLINTPENISAKLSKFDQVKSIDLFKLIEMSDTIDSFIFNFRKYNDRHINFICNIDSIYLLHSKYFDDDECANNIDYNITGTNYKLIFFFTNFFPEAYVKYHTIIQQLFNVGVSDIFKTYDQIKRNILLSANLSYESYDEFIKLDLENIFILIRCFALKNNTDNNNNNNINNAIVAREILNNYSDYMLNYDIFSKKYFLLIQNDEFIKFDIEIITAYIDHNMYSGIPEFKIIDYIIELFLTRAKEKCVINEFFLITILKNYCNCNNITSDEVIRYKDIHSSSYNYFVKKNLIICNEKDLDYYLKVIDDRINNGYYPGRCVDIIMRVICIVDKLKIDYPVINKNTIDAIYITYLKHFVYSDESHPIEIDESLTNFILHNSPDFFTKNLFYDGICPSSQIIHSNNTISITITKTNQLWRPSDSRKIIALEKYGVDIIEFIIHNNRLLYDIDILDRFIKIITNNNCAIIKDTMVPDIFDENYCLLHQKICEIFGSIDILFNVAVKIYEQLRKYVSRDVNVHLAMIKIIDIFDFDNTYYDIGVELLLRLPDSNIICHNSNYSYDLYYKYSETYYVYIGNYDPMLCTHAIISLELNITSLPHIRSYKNIYYCYTNYCKKKIEEIGLNNFLDSIVISKINSDIFQPHSQLLYNRIIYDFLIDNYITSDELNAFIIDDSECECECECESKLG